MEFGSEVFLQITSKNLYFNYGHIALKLTTVTKPYVKELLLKYLLLGNC